MQPILPINLTFAGGPTGMLDAAGSAQPTAGNSLSAGNAQGVLSAQGTSTQSIQQIDSSVSQLLQAVGGSIQNDRLLKLLIGIILLLSLLDNMNSDKSASQDQPGGLGSGQGDQSQFVGIFSSSTTISIEQTSTTYLIDPGMLGLDGNAQDSPSQGVNLDLSA